MKKEERNIALEGLDSMFGTLDQYNEPIQEQEETPIATPKKEETKSQKNDTIESNHEKEESTREVRAIGRPRINKEQPYKITFIVDEEIEEYMKQQPFITMETRKDYVNRLIKEDFERRIGATRTDNEKDIQRKWNDYKERVRQNFQN